MEDMLDNFTDSSMYSETGLRKRQNNGEVDNLLKNAIYELDIINPKLEEDHIIKTELGGLLTILCGLFMFFLFINELKLYINPDPIETIEIDSTTSKTININFDITFHAISCQRFKLDLMDTTGKQILDASHFSSITKQRLDLEGNLIGKPIKGDNLEENPNDTFRDLVFEALGMIQHVSEGCRVAGNFGVSKVAGNFHTAIGLSASSGSRHIHQFGPNDMQTYNCSHTINYLAFGNQPPYDLSMPSPLEGVSGIVHEETAAFQYYVKLVPTMYEYGWFSYETNQYSITEHAIRMKRSQAISLPGVFFLYDISPFMVRVNLNSYSFAQFLTSICAILGGVYTLSKLLDSVLYNIIGDVSIDKYIQNGGRRLSKK